jgi:hypothetical protein
MINIQFHNPADMYLKDHQVNEFLLNAKYDIDSVDRGLPKAPFTPYDRLGR